MTKFVQLNLSTTHAGVERLQNAGAVFSLLAAYLRRQSFNRPVERLVQILGHAGAAWTENRRLAAEDRKMWNLALTDARVMADIQAAMAAARPA